MFQAEKLIKQKKLSQEVIKYSFKVKNKIKTTVSILKDKINGLKSMIMIKIYSLFDFESFELLDIFDDFDYEIKEPKSNDEMLDDLFENEDFKKVYNIILDHFFKHRKSKKEELVVVSKENKIIFRKTGNDKTVQIPLELYMLKNYKDILIMIHNHPNGGVIPSESDVCAIVNFQSVFGAITNSNQIGILENNNKKPFEKNIRKLFLEDFELFKLDIYYKIDIEFSNMFNLINDKCDRAILDLLKVSLFYSYIINNIEELSNDFNFRMEKYGLKFSYMYEGDFEV